MQQVSGSGTLSEAASKALLGDHGVPFAPEREVTSPSAAVEAADALGYPVVVKLCGAAIAHKTERGLVKLRLGDATAVTDASEQLLASATPDDGDVSLLVAPMVSGNRELIAGVVRDPQFGANVMLGVGGIIAEAIADVQFRPAPISEIDAGEMIEHLATQKLLGKFRGESEVDRQQLASVLLALSALVAARPDIISVDVNPLIITADGAPIAVDALVELGDSTIVEARSRKRPTDAQFRALFEPKGVLVAGASTHPGKFGFVGLHNILASGYDGAVYGTNLEGEEVLGIRTVSDVSHAARWCHRPGLRLYAGGRQHGAAPGLRGEGREGRVRHQRRLWRSRSGRPRRRGGTGRSRRRARHAAGRAQRAGVWSARRPTCAPRSWRRTRRAAASPWPVRVATSSAVS